MPDWMKEERQSRRELGTRNAKGVEMAIKQRSSKVGALREDTLTRVDIAHAHYRQRCRHPREPREQLTD
jgi:hypothetical protein